MLFILIIFGLFILSIVLNVNQLIKKYFPKNHYIETHKKKLQNDKAYEDYLNWLDKKGGDLPIEKELTPEEKDFQKKIKI